MMTYPNNANRIERGVNSPRDSRKEFSHCSLPVARAEPRIFTKGTTDRHFVEELYWVYMTGAVEMHMRRGLVIHRRNRRLATCTFLGLLRQQLNLEGLEDEGNGDDKEEYYYNKKSGRDREPEGGNEHEDKQFPASSRV